MNLKRFPMALFALAATAAGALEPDQVQISYELKLGTRQISGVSHALEWSFWAIDAESAQVRLRVPVDSFDSGHGDFDSALQGALAAKEYPLVEVEGTVRDGLLDGTLSLRGVERPVSIRLGIQHLGGKVIAAGAFTIDLREYGVVLEGVEPIANIEVVVRLLAAPGAALAGGSTQPAR